VEPEFLTDPLEENEDYFLWVGRITEPYKQLSPVVEAFSEMITRLVVAGDGPDRDRLEGRATSNMQFVGWSRPERGIGAEYPSRRSFASNTATPSRGRAARRPWRTQARPRVTNTRGECTPARSSL